MNVGKQPSQVGGPHNANDRLRLVDTCRYAFWRIPVSVEWPVPQQRNGIIIAFHAFQMGVVVWHHARRVSR